MEPSSKRKIVYVIAAVALVAALAIGANIQPVTLWEGRLSEVAVVEGEVLSIEVLPPNGNVAQRKEAVVKLSTGETVRAYVPEACVIFVGQQASLSKLDHEQIKMPFYVVKGPV